MVRKRTINLHHQPKRSRKKAPFLAIVLLLLLVGSLAFNAYLIKTKRDESQVARVVDGDSLDLADGRRIRLLGVDAPERGRCMFEDALSFLSDATTGQRVQLTDTVKDDYGRLLANVYVGKVFINELILKEGFARYTSTGGSKKDVLAAAHQEAVAQKKGVYSDQCRNSLPSDSCSIKGNAKGGQKTYHLPGCNNYDQTIIDESYGDQWFCTEEEAKGAGFTKASGCPAEPAR